MDTNNQQNRNAKTGNKKLEFTEPWQLENYELIPQCKIYRSKA